MRSMVEGARPCPSPPPARSPIFRRLDSADGEGMALQQSIDLALAANIGEAGLPQTALDAARAGVGERPQSASPRTTRAGACRSLACRPRPGTWTRSALPRRGFGTAPATWSSSAPADRASAGRRWPSFRITPCRGLGRFAEAPRVHFLDNLDPQTFGGFLEALPLATSRFVAISKSGGTGETLMQAIAVLSALDKAGLSRPRRRSLPRPVRSRAARAPGTACATSSSPRASPFLDHHTGIGGRYSVLTNVGLLPAAVLGLDIGAIRAGAADAYAPFRGRRGRRCPGGGGRGAQPRLRHGGQGDHRAHGLCRPARALHALVGAALGREPRQGRQGLAAGGARSGRSTSTRSSSSILPGRTTSCSPCSPSRRQGRGLRSTRSSRGAPASRALPGGRIGDLVAAQGRATAETLAQERPPDAHLHVERLDERSDRRAR